VRQINWDGTSHLVVSLVAATAIMSSRRTPRLGGFREAEDSPGRALVANLAHFGKSLLEKNF
jgi:hypothetical protein